MCFLHYQHEGIFVKQMPSWERILELEQANVILSADNKQEYQENIHCDGQWELQLGVSYDSKFEEL